MAPKQLHERVLLIEEGLRSLQKTNAEAWAQIRQEMREQVGYIRGVMDALVYLEGREKVQTARNELTELQNKARKEAAEKREQEMLDRLREGLDKGFVRQLVEATEKSIVFCRLGYEPLLLNLATDPKAAQAFVGKTVGDVVDDHTVLMIFETVDKPVEA